MNGQRNTLLRAAMGVARAGNWHPISIEGCKIAIEELTAETSESQPIVCLHDAGSGSREFLPLRHRLPAQTRVIFVDWPGHGRSADCGLFQPPLVAPSSTDPAANSEFSIRYSVHLLHQILNRLAVRRPILLGSGFGAAVAIRYAADHPYRPLGLILCQPDGLFPAHGLRQTLRESLRQGFRKLLPEFAAPPLSPEATRHLLRTLAAKRALQRIVAQADDSLVHSGASLKAALRAIRCPVFFALSRASAEHPASHYQALLDPLLTASPQHRFTAFQGSFHPIWDQPELFSQALNAFLQSILPVDRHQHSWQLTTIDWPADNTNLWKCVHPACQEERILPTGANPNQPDAPG